MGGKKKYIEMFVSFTESFNYPIRHRQICTDSDNWIKLNICESLLTVCCHTDYCKSKKQQ